MNFKRVKQLEELVAVNKVQKVPKGWFTISQYAKYKNVGVKQASININSLIESFPEKVELKKFTIKAGLRIMPIQHYKIK